MMIQIQISDHKLKYFKEISEIDSKIYSEIIKKFSSIGEKLLTIDEFTTELRQYLNPAKAIALSSTLISLRRLKGRYECSSSEILDSIAQALREKGYSKEASDWEDNRGSIITLVEADITGTTENASDLYYRHINYCHDFKAITECRPVIVNNNEGLVGYVTINNLYLVYSRGNRRETTVSIALGLEQLKGLSREINKAIDQTEFYQKLCEKENKLNRVYDGKW